MNKLINNYKSIKPIKWSNIVNWFYQTVVADLRRYKPEHRSITLQRLWRMVLPNLQRPIFIIGSGRSGTTFLGSCIAEIPEISYHFEPIATKAAARYVYESSWDSTKAQWFYRTVYAWLMRFNFNGDLIFAEKTPRNSFIVPFLHETFPDARFINIIRDGRDVALSLVKKPWYRADAVNSGQREPGGYLQGPSARFWVEKDRVQEFETTNDIHRCIWLWRQYQKHLMESTRNLPTKQYHELRYENLVFNPTEEADNLLDFLEIFDPKSRNLFQKAIATKVKADSVGRWKYELLDNQLEQIEKEAGQLLFQLGYTHSDSEFKVTSD